MADIKDGGGVSTEETKGMINVWKSLMLMFSFLTQLLCHSHRPFSQPYVEQSLSPELVE